MSLTENMVLESLKKLIDPNTDKNLVDTKSVKSIDIVDDKPNLKICLGYPAKNFAETLNHMIIDRLSNVPISKLVTKFLVTSFLLKVGITTASFFIVMSFLSYFVAVSIQKKINKYQKKIRVNHSSAISI